jgi:hypothetical protein
MVRILFVGTSTLSLEQKTCIYSDKLTDLKKQCSKKMFNYALLNNLIDISNDDFTVWREDMPEKYDKYFIGDVISHDLDEYRDIICQKVIEFYKGSDKIMYDTCDQFVLPPGNLKSKVKSNDKKFSKKYGIKFSFQKHYNCMFQEYIEMCNVKYDIIWFLGCCNPDFVIDMNKSYIKNFKRILTKNGLIIHMDPVVDHKLKFIAFDDRIKILNKKGCYDCDCGECESFEDKLQIVEYLIENLVKVGVGIYRFDL